MLSAERPPKDLPEPGLGFLSGLREKAFRRTCPVTFPLEVPTAVQLERLRTVNGGWRAER